MRIKRREVESQISITLKISGMEQMQNSVGM